jgi:hypothetical protein
MEFLLGSQNQINKYKLDHLSYDEQKYKQIKIKIDLN